MTDAELFDQLGCTRVDGFIDPTTVSIVSRYLENKIRRGEWQQGPADPEQTSRFSYYADPLIEVLLEASKEAVEAATGKTLIPTYSYARVYQPGEELKPHVDRPSCEISVTVNVATKGEFSPIYTKYKGAEPQRHVLSPGDAVIYKGCEVVHWRRPLEADQLNVQFMLHYVDKDGHNASYAKDRRPNYGMSAPTRS